MEINFSYEKLYEYLLFTGDTLSWIQKETWCDMIFKQKKGNSKTTFQPWTRYNRHKWTSFKKSPLFYIAWKSIKMNVIFGRIYETYLI